MGWDGVNVPKQTASEGQIRSFHMSERSRQCITRAPEWGESAGQLLPPLALDSATSRFLRSPVIFPAGRWAGGHGAASAGLTSGPVPCCEGDYINISCGSQTEQGGAKNLESGLRRWIRVQRTLGKVLPPLSPQLLYLGNGKNNNDSFRLNYTKHLRLWGPDGVLRIGARRKHLPLMRSNPVCETWPISSNLIHGFILSPNVPSQTPHPH